MSASLPTRVTGWLQDRIGGRAMILGYHRVGLADWDPAGLTVDPEHFQQQLECILRFGTVVPLSRITAYLQGEPLPRRSVVLTFDDGYHDNLTELLPLLERYEAPATVFVTTGSPGNFFWWDELSAILDPEHSLPEVMELESLSTTPAWTRRCSPATGRSTAPERSKFYQALAAQLSALSVKTRSQVLRELRLWADTTREPADGARSLTRTEIRVLSGSPLIKIGAHSVSHPLLAELSDTEVAVEVKSSFATLRELATTPVTGFSYPHGSSSEVVRAALTAVGADYSCASDSRLIDMHSDPFLLPRYWPGDFEGDRFFRWIHARWFGL